MTRAAGLLLLVCALLFPQGNAAAHEVRPVFLDFTR